MANTVLFGSQWGDEGKGKVIDVLTQDAHWVVRYQGGNNACLLYTSPSPRD